MSDNILRGIISITAPNLPATANAVNRSVTGMERTLVKAGAAGQSFGVGASRASASLKPLASSSNQATLALGNLGRVAQDAPFGFIGIANNLNPLLESFQRLKATTGTTGGALKALGSSLTGAGGLGLALSVVSSLAIVFSDKIFGSSKAAEKAKTSMEQLQESINGVFKESAKEAAEVGSLITVLRSETETRERKLSAIKELQRIQPDIFNGLKLEGNAVVGLDNAYKNYLGNLKNVIAAKILQVKLEAKIEELLKKQGVTATTAFEKQLAEDPDKFLRLRSDAFSKSASGKAGDRNPYLELLNANKEARKEAESKIQKDIEDLFGRLQQLSKSIKVPEIKTGSVKAKPDKLTIEPTKIEIPESVKPTVSVKGVFDFSEFSNAALGGSNTALTLQQKMDEFIAAQNLKIKVSPLIEPQFVKDNKSFAENYLAQVKTLASTISDVLTPAFSSFFNTVANGGNAFKAFAQAAIQALVGLISKLVTTAVLSLIVSSITGGGAAVGAASNKFGDIFKALSGFGGFRAAGGPVSAGKSYIVGENGPEIFNPGTSGNIIPNNRINSFSGGGISGMMGRVVFEISGNKLIGVLANGSRSQRSLV